MSSNQGRAQNGQSNSSQQLASWRLAGLEADIGNDQNRTGILKDGGSPGIGGPNGFQIGQLTEDNTKDSEDD